MAGETTDFEGLVREYQGRVRAFFATRLADSSLVDDLAQETFFVAYRRLSTFDRAQPFYPWLRGIALNILLNETRKHRPRAEDPRALAAILERLAAEASDRLGDVDLSSELRDCIGRLGDAAARLLKDRYEERLPIAVLARREGKTAKTLAVTLVRIRHRLRECLESKNVRGSLAEGGAA